jgi:endonuclease YncB( thermonuclease family)
MQSEQEGCEMSYLKSSLTNEICMEKLLCGDLLRFGTAGLSSPPSYISHGDQRGEWLRRLAAEKTMIKLQLLGRRVPEQQDPPTTWQKEPYTKRDVTAVLPEIQTEKNESRKVDEDQIAVCRLYYRPKLFQFWATDVADSLVRFGHASVNSEVFMKNEHTAKTKIVDTSTRLDDLRKDVKYLERLEKLEYEAAKGSFGMWSDSRIREMRRDVVEEVEFQTKANMLQKFWRWFRS